MTKKLVAIEANNIDCKIRTRLRQRGFVKESEWMELRMAIAEIIKSLVDERQGDERPAK